MSTHGAATGEKTFKPSLSLKDIRTRVGSLSDRRSEVLFDLANGLSDAKVAENAQTTIIHLPRILGQIYQVLGIVEALPESKKREAAVLMNQIYERQGWRPDKEQTSLLLRAFGLSDEPIEFEDEEPEVVLAPVEGVPHLTLVSPSADVAPEVEPSSAATTHQPINGSDMLEADTSGADTSALEESSMDVRPVAANSLHGVDLGPIIARIASLYTDEKISETRIKYLDTICGAESLPAAANVLGIPPNNFSAMFVHLKPLFGIPTLSADTRRAASILERDVLLAAWGEFRTGPGVSVAAKAMDSTAAPAVIESPQNAGAEADSSPADNVPVQQQREIAGKIAVALKAADGGLSAREFEILDTLATEGTVSRAAEVLNTSTGRISTSCTVAKHLIGIPSLENKKAETEMLIGVWKYFRAYYPDFVPKKTRGGKAADDPSPKDTLKPAPSPQEPEPPTPVVQEAREEVEQSRDLQPEAELPPPEPTVEAQPVPPPTPTEVPIEPVPETAPALEGTIVQVRTLWSNSPTFLIDQMKFVNEGYRIERKPEHFVTFDPVFNAVSVVTLVKRA